MTLVNLIYAKVIRTCDSLDLHADTLLHNEARLFPVCSCDINVLLQYAFTCTYMLYTQLAY